MNLKNVLTAGLCFVTLVILTSSLTMFVKSRGPSDSFIKSLIEKQMTSHIKNCTITSMTVLRGETFALQAHASKVGYGTPILPVVVRATYTTKLPDGTQSESMEFNRTLNFYKNASHQWENDNELH